MKTDDIYYQAMCARDHRFDGKFFVGVKTTGVYCRPICPAKPKRKNVEFYPNHLAAEKAGYRPCLRCRPESAPQSPAWIGTSAVVKRALRVIYSQETINYDEETFASQFGITARHLRRLFIAEIGKTPKQLSFENRLNLARTFLIETSLAITEIALAAGFTSIRRFNDAFKDRFKKPPRDIRRNKTKLKNGLVITLPYRPPFDFDGLLASYANHRIGQLEWFTKDKMHRLMVSGNTIGQVSIANNAKLSALEIEIDFPDTSMLHAIITRVRNMFDLNSDPIVIANTLETNPAIKKLLRKTPGIRLPSGWDSFEIAISTILGQLVSVTFGRRLVNDLIEIAGKTIVVNSATIKLFPTPQEIIETNLTALKTTTVRKRTLVAFSTALIENHISLEPTQDVDKFIKDVCKIKGIGLWTAEYMALKILRNTDTFPASDLVLARALTVHPKQVIDTMSPWRGYVAALLWREHSKQKKVK
jgi:AraC family transcriptional regulator of adaptative response / DNA-3-methyladenine glycosylase II